MRRKQKVKNSSNNYYIKVDTNDFPPFVDPDNPNRIFQVTELRCNAKTLMGGISQGKIKEGNWEKIFGRKRSGDPIDIMLPQEIERLGFEIGRGPEAGQELFEKVRQICKQEFDE